MAKESDAEKTARFERALKHLIDRVSEDRYVLAVVLVGSLSEDTIWDRESLGLVDHRSGRRQQATAK